MTSRTGRTGRTRPSTRGATPTAGQRVGALAWSRRTGGQLTGAERRQLLRALARAQGGNVLGRVAMLLRLNSGRHTELPERTWRTPSSALTRTAEQVALERLTPALLHHAYRCYLFGVALAGHGDVEVDRELLFAAAMLHDLGLAAAVPGVDFTLTGARVARDVAETVGLSTAATEIMRTAITLHHSPGVTLADGAVAYLLSAGHALDVLGLRAGQLPAAVLSRVVAEHPRLGFTRVPRCLGRRGGGRPEGPRRAAASLPPVRPQRPARPVPGLSRPPDPGQLAGASGPPSEHCQPHPHRKQPAMTTTDTRLPRQPGTPASPTTTARRGPHARIVLASVLTGALAAPALVLVAFAGAPEHVLTGVALLGFAAGWALLAALTTRMTSSPQRWAYGLAAFLGGCGLALVTLAPGDNGLTAAAWVWPPVLLVLTGWSARRAHASMPGRSSWLVFPVLGVLALSAVGALGQDVAAESETAPMVMPGALYDVGGHRLHLSCTGTGTPTVVLESGLGGNSPLWTRVIDGLAPTTRVCAYDRAGIGWSDDAPRLQDSLAVVADLHRLLEVSGEPGPYVLAGHSVGGVYALTYAARYPEQVAGMVLLDSASPRQFTVLPGYEADYAMMTRLYSVLPTLARLGVGRLLPSLVGNDVPGAAGEQAARFAATPRDARTARDELSTYRRAFAQARSLTTLGDTPLVVVTAAENEADTKGWGRAQQQLAALSSNADHRSVASSHIGLLDDPTASAASVTAIADVVHTVRSGSPLGTP